VRALRWIVIAMGLLSVPGRADPTAGPEGAAPGSPGQVSRWLIRNGRWFDGQDFTAGDRSVVDGVFVDALPAAPERTLDLHGAYVIPPFGEAHNHNLEDVAAAPALIRRYLHDGVFYIKNPTDVAEQVARVRPLINRPDSVDAVYAHAGITATDGHPMLLYRFVSERPGNPYPGGYLDRAYVFVDTPADLDRVWPRLMADRPDFIKIFLLYTDSFRKRRDDPAFRGLKGLDPALVPLVVERAHAAGLRVTAHVETAADFRVAVQGGVDEIAHLPGYTFGVFNVERYVLSPADAAQAAARGVTVVTTTSIARNDPGNRLAQIEENQIANLRLLRAAGVHLAIGSDDYRETSVVEAMNLLRLGAFDTRALLNLWTRDTAVAIFPQRRLGVLKPGYEASFLVLGGDPLSDFRETGHILLRFKQGWLLPEQ
jgi:hypothetical protein